MVSKFQKRHYQILAPLIGESEDLAMFTRLLCFELRKDNYNFSDDRFNGWIKKVKEND